MRANTAAKFVAMVIKDYMRTRPVVYPTSFEKECHYDWGLQEALRRIRNSDEMPLTVLEKMLGEFDTRAHEGTNHDYMFGVVVSAIDDIIQLILS